MVRRMHKEGDKDFFAWRVIASKLSALRVLKAKSAAWRGTRHHVMRDLTRDFRDNWALFSWTRRIPSKINKSWQTWHHFLVFFVLFPLTSDVFDLCGSSWYFWSKQLWHSKNKSIEKSFTLHKDYEFQCYFGQNFSTDHFWQCIRPCSVVFHFTRHQPIA